MISSPLKIIEEIIEEAAVDVIIQLLRRKMDNFDELIEELKKCSNPKLTEEVENMIAIMNVHKIDPNLVEFDAIRKMLYNVVIKKNV